MLNALDGVTSSQGRIVVMTTNYIDRLDPALIRPGRVDVKQYIGYATEYQATTMFIRFYPKASPHMAIEFGKKIVSFNKLISAAHLQGYFMLFKDDPQGAFQNTESYFNKV